MANTYTQLNVHGIFTVERKEFVLRPHIREKLFPYISGILKNLAQYPLAIGGYNDHVHIFFELNPTSSVSDVMQQVKSNSSRWINDNRFIRGRFSWQKGYGAFTYAKSQRNEVIEYIKNQEKHHSTRSFKDEYLSLLQRFDIKYNDDYLFQFFEPTHELKGG